MRGKKLRSLAVLALFPLLAGASSPPSSSSQTPPQPDATLSQEDPQTQSPLEVGGILKGRLITLSAYVPWNWESALRLCVEIREIGIAFTGDSVAHSPYASPGGYARITIPLPKKTKETGCHWQAWFENPSKSTSPKVSFPVANPNSESVADFIIPESDKTIYEINFDKGEAPGWYLERRRPEGSAVRWDIDGHPLSVPGKPYFSPYHSLNFNADATGTYDVPGRVVRGWAESPQLNISGSLNPHLAFRCNYDTDTMGKKTDQRWVRIYSGYSYTTPVYVEQLATNGGTCADMGTWHRHMIPMQESWKYVTVQFFFHSVDTIENNHAGWFIDDFEVFSNTRPGPVGASLQQYDSNGSVVPVGDPVTNRIDIKAVLSDLDGDPLQLQVEVRPLMIPFLGKPTHGSSRVSSGKTAVISLTELEEGAYHYQARAKDFDGGYSRWDSFGGNSEREADFIFVRGGTHKGPDSDEDRRASLCGGSIAGNDKGSFFFLAGMIIVLLLAFLGRSRIGV